jgi:serine/threonine protein phosphatase PrpC
MLQIHSFSEVGGHPENEDAFVVQQHPLDKEAWLCFLADGLGGHAGGGQAARLACHNAASGYSPEQLCELATWTSIFRSADKSVAGDAMAGFTTLVGLCVSRQLVVGASAGDSAVLLISGDHAKELTSGQKKNPPLGSGGAEATPFLSTFKSPWQILVMSDGVWKYLGWEQIAVLANRFHGTALIEELQKPARLPGSGKFQDDFTMVVIGG